MPRKAKIDCIVFGGGGHARVVMECLRLSGVARPVAVVDANPALRGQRVAGVRVAGGDESLPGLKRRGLRHFAVGVGGTGDNRLRQRLFELGVAHGLQPLEVVHPTAICSPDATVGRGVQRMPGSIVNTGVVLGDDVIVNTGAIVEHDCQVGAHAHLASGSVLCGGVRVGMRAHVGGGAVVRQGIMIGDGAVVAAGAVVVKDVQPGDVVAGVPARPLRRR
ncbi:MAG: acetyltransferase [Lentisphaerae bacterium]|nr:acetyltransferase [Lentisphaerota bacterium]